VALMLGAVNNIHKSAFSDFQGTGRGFKAFVLCELFRDIIAGITAQGTKECFFQSNIQLGKWYSPALLSVSNRGPDRLGHAHFPQDLQ
jgi:hypothetical protein